MDRAGQLRNVAFGGAWSERIAGDERLSQALDILDSCAATTAEVDHRRDASMRTALTLLSQEHPRGIMLGNAWVRALSLPYPEARQAEMERVARLLREGLSARLG